MLQGLLLHHGISFTLPVDPQSHLKKSQQSKTTQEEAEKESD